VLTEWKSVSGIGVGRGDFDASAGCSGRGGGTDGPGNPDRAAPATGTRARLRGRELEPPGAGMGQETRKETEMLATEYAEYHGIEPQGGNETDADFRLRVSNALRANGHIIEAQEAYHDQRYENSDIVMAGLFGEIGQALGKVPQYSAEGTHSNEGDKVAAGVVLQHKRDEPDPAVMLLACLLR